MKRLFFLLLLSTGLAQAKTPTPKPVPTASARPVAAASPAPSATPAAAPSRELISSAEPAGTPAPTGISRAPVPAAIDQFFSLIMQDKIDSAYNLLTNGTKIASNPQEIENLKSKTREAIRVFGEFEGHEQVEMRAVGQRLIRVTELSLGRQFPLRWRFYFYYAENRWRLIDIRVDDRLAEMFEEKSGAAAADQ